MIKAIAGWLSDKILLPIGGAILQGIRTLLFLLCTVIYGLIIRVYDIFNALCSARLLNNEVISNVSQRVGLLLGIIMFLVVSFSFIQILVEPDKLTDKEMGVPALIKKVIIVIILLGFSSYAFTLLSDIQRYVVRSNIIAKVLMPYEVTVTVNNEQLSDPNVKFGNILSIELLTAFYEIPEKTDELEIEYDSSVESTVYACNNIIESMKMQIYKYGDFNLGYMCLNEPIVYSTGLNGGGYEKQEGFLVDFNGFTAVVAGIGALFLIASYAFKVATRMIQLAVLEIISPMAFIAYLSPKKETMLSKWAKIYFSTYIDVFIRIAIINFGVFIIEAIFATETAGVSNLWSQVQLMGLPWSSRLLLKVILILAVLAFCRKAPDLIKDLIPPSASKLGFGASLKEMAEYVTPAGRFAAAGAGVATYGVTGAIGRFTEFRRVRKNDGVLAAFGAALGGLTSGTVRGMSANLRKGNLITNFSKGLSEQRKRDNEVVKLYEQGGTLHGKAGAVVADIFGGARGTVDSRRIDMAKKVSDPLKEIVDSAEKTRAYQNLMDLKNAALMNKQYNKAARIQKVADEFEKEYIKDSLQGRTIKKHYKYTIDGFNYDVVTSANDQATISNSIRTKYISSRAEVNQINPVIVDETGKVTGTMNLLDPNAVTLDIIKEYIRTATTTQQNIMGTPGYRKGQVEKPNDGGSSNNNS